MPVIITADGELEQTPRNSVKEALRRIIEYAKKLEEASQNERDTQARDRNR